MSNPRKVRYGERRDEATGKVVEDEGEQAIIRRILERRQTGFDPWRECAR